MKNKKSPSANLENKRLIFFQIGIIISLSLVLTAFEVRSYDELEIDLTQSSGEVVIDLLPPITFIPKKPIPVPKAVTVINPVPNDDPVPDDGLIFDPIIDEGFMYSEYVPDLPDEQIEEDEVFVTVEEKTEFPGGISALFNYLSANIKYPLMAMETGIQGVVYLQFVVEKDGSITDIELMRSVEGGCNEEAIRVVRGMPRWKPGRQFNKVVRVRYTLPIRFVLQ